MTEQTTVDMESSSQTFRELWASFKETENRFKDIASKQEGTENLLKDIARKQEETDRQLKKTDRIVGDLGNRFGEMAEYLVAPNIEEKFNKLGFHFQGCLPGGMEIRDKENNILAQIDIMLENSDSIIAIEVKAKPHLQDIEHHIKRIEILREHKDFFNDRRKILGAIAGAIFPKEVKIAVLEAGFYVLEQSGDTMRLTTPDNSKIRKW